MKKFEGNVGTWNGDTLTCSTEYLRHLQPSEPTYTYSLKVQIKEWCAKNMPDTTDKVGKYCWEKLFLASTNMLYMLRVCPHDNGGSIVLLIRKNDGSNCVIEDGWLGFSLGNIKSIEQLIDLHNWLDQYIGA